MGAQVIFPFLQFFEGVDQLSGGCQFLDGEDQILFIAEDIAGDAAGLDAVTDDQGGDMGGIGGDGRMGAGADEHPAAGDEPFQLHAVVVGQQDDPPGALEFRLEFFQRFQVVVAGPDDMGDEGDLQVGGGNDVLNKIAVGLEDRSCRFFIPHDQGTDIDPDGVAGDESGRQGQFHRIESEGGIGMEPDILQPFFLQGIAGDAFPGGDQGITLQILEHGGIHGGRFNRASPKDGFGSAPVQ